MRSRRLGLFVSRAIKTLVIISFLSLNSPSQTTVQPTPIGGINSVSFDSGSGSVKYLFKRNGIPCFKYSITNDGSFKGILAYDSKGDSLWPSDGGIGAYLGGDTCNQDTSYGKYFCLGHQILNNDTVYTKWEMRHNNDTLRYSYKFKLVGQTLVIVIESDSVDPSSNKAMYLTINQCYAKDKHPKPIRIPYLQLFSILLCDQDYVSFFSDWENTNASEIWGSNLEDAQIDTTSRRSYAQVLRYNKKTNGLRNRLHETFYLTISSSFADVLPNIPNPISGYKDTSANHILWDYRQTFARLIRPPWRHLDTIWGSGVGNIWIQIHDWQHYHGTLRCDNSPQKTGYDDGYPCVLPANEENSAGNEYGGTPALDSIITKARFTCGYRVGLHLNYVDVYDDAPCTNLSGSLALSPDAQAETTWYNNGICMRAKLLKPSLAGSFVSDWGSQIKSLYNINGCYLDVHSAGNPSQFVDYDSGILRAGRFSETLSKYRNLYSILRSINGGPVQGEGGCHMLYLGYVDDVEARLTLTGPDSIIYSGGYNFPLLVDFDLYKLHSKTMSHGVGVYDLFVTNRGRTATRDTVLAYIATELAYGHGGYLPDIDATFDIVKHAKLEYKHVFSVQKDYANATPTSIMYYDGNGGGPYTASEYIKNNPYYADTANPTQFMSRVMVTYDNGLVVCVNRHHRNQWQNIHLGVSGGWFNFHAIVGGVDSLYTGVCSATSFTLPPNNGWVVYDPLKTDVKIKNSVGSVNAGGALLLDGTTKVVSGDSISLTIGSLHPIGTMAERFVLDSTYKHHDWNNVFTERKLTTSFVARLLTPQNGQYNSLNPVLLRNELMDAQSLNGGILSFRDPWYLDSVGNQPDTLIAYNLSNGPYSPTGAFGKNTGGIFLYQTNLSPGYPYYSVRAFQIQSISSYDSCNFINWSVRGSSTTSSIVNNPTNLESPVVFKHSNDTVCARYKGRLLTSNITSTGSNNQRKIKRDNGVYHLVYESAGDIWYTHSNDGNYWSPEIRLSDGSGTSKYPSLDCFSTQDFSFVQVVWAGSNCVHFREYRNDIGWETEEFLNGCAQNDCQFQYGMGYDCRPVVCWGFVAFNGPDMWGTVYGSSIFLVQKTDSGWNYNDVPNSSNRASKPSIIVTPQSVTHVVYQDSSTDAIMYNVKNQYGWIYSTSINLSSGYTLTNCSSPSIDGREPGSNSGYLYVAWKGFDTSRAANVIAVRKKTNGSWTPSYIKQFSSGLPRSTNPLNYYDPVVTRLWENELDTNNLVVVWGASDSTIRIARYFPLNDAWCVYRPNITSVSNYPTVMYPKDGTKISMKICYPVGTVAPYHIQFFTESSTNPFSLALNNKSSTNTATANNNQRKLYRELTIPTLHEVFESSGEIFYRKSTNDGVAWQLTSQISDGSGGNSAPCIGMTTSNIILVSWQQAQSSKYNIVLKRSTDDGGTWSSATFIDTQIVCNSPGPLASVSGSSNSNAYIVYRTNSSLKCFRSTNSGVQWLTMPIVPGSIGKYNEPSTFVDRTYWATDQLNVAYATNAQDSSSRIYTSYYDPNGWSTPNYIDVTSVVPSNYVHHANPSFARSKDANNVVHLVWDAWDSLAIQRVILHRKGSFRAMNLNQYSVIRYQSQNKPSVIGLGGDSAWVVFQNASGNGIWKAKFRWYGTYGVWGMQSYVTNGFNPQLSIGSGTGKYLYDSSSTAPYQITLASEALAKELGQYTDWHYTREMNFMNPLNGSTVTLEVTPPSFVEVNGSTISGEFTPNLSDSGYTSTTLMRAGGSSPVVIPVDADSLAIDYSLSGVNVAGIFSGSSSWLKFQIVNNQNGNVLAEFGMRSFDGSLSSNREVMSLVIPIREYAPQFAGIPVIIRPVLDTLITSNGSLTASLGHVYRGDPFGAMNKTTIKLEKIATASLKPTVYRLRDAHPNPFNPVTQIEYDLPQNSQVILEVYNSLGERVSVPVNGYQEAGYRSIQFNGTNLPSGVYFYRIQAGVPLTDTRQWFTQTKKMMLVK
jgi:hypothetical protein